MKKLIILLLVSCFHSAVEAIGGTEENLLNFALTAIQNNGKAIARLADSIDRKLDVMKTELRDEIQKVRTDLGKEIQLIRNELGNETQGIKTRLRKESEEIQAQILALSNRLVGKIQAIEEKSLETLFTKHKDVFEEKFASLNSTILINHANLASKVDLLGSENRNSSAAIHEIIVENRSSLDTLLFNAFGIELQGQEWITIQRRGAPLKAGNTTREKFHNRTWTEYENGFGSEDFWIGLDKIHKLTKVGCTELRVDLEDWEGNTAYALYSVFHVSGSWDNYRLTVSGYSGNAGNSLSMGIDSRYSHSGSQFSTVDRDHDNSTGSCALGYGPWWHNSCSHSHLNFEYQNQSNVTRWQGIIWQHWKGDSYSLKKTELKIRRPPAKLSI